MDITEKDFAHMQNILRCLKQGKFDLSGEETLAFAQSYTWAINLGNTMKQEVLLKKQQQQVISNAKIDTPAVQKPKRSKKVAE